MPPTPPERISPDHIAADGSAWAVPTDTAETVPTAIAVTVTAAPQRRSLLPPPRLETREDTEELSAGSWHFTGSAKNTLGHC